MPSDAPQVIRSLGHHEVFLLLVQLCVMCATARVFGEVMRKLRQPPVVGELAAGVVLGPSVLGVIWPEAQSAIFPRVQAQADLLAVVSWIGVLFLLIVTGLETDLELIKRKGRTALLVSVGGIVVPFGTGLAMGWSLPDRFMSEPDARVVFALFMAVAMSISAVPVIAKVLIDMKLIRRDIGQVTLAAGMTDDTVGWILLSVVASLATRGEVDGFAVGRSVVVAIGFIAFALTIGRAVVARIVAVVDDLVSDTTAQFSLLVVMGLAVAAFTHEMGIEAVLGAFVVGILFGQAPRFRPEVAHSLETVTAGFVAPVFFASAGLKVDLVRLMQPEVALVGAGVLAIACFGKFLGAYVGAWAGGLRHWERLALGAGMNARGAMEIVVATVGLSLGVLTPEMYSIVVMVAIVTSLMAPPILRWTLSHVELGHEEATRLERERLSAESFLHSLRRMMLVASTTPTTELAARIVGALSKVRSLAPTLLVPSTKDASRSIGSPDETQRVEDVEAKVPRLRELARRDGLDPEVRRRSGTSSGQVVLDECAGFDLVVLGARERTRGVGVALFGRQVDPVIVGASCATLVVEPARGLLRVQALTRGAPIRRIVVPTIGTQYSKHALEIASGIATASDASILLLHVVPRGDADRYLLDRQGHGEDRELGDELVQLQADVARGLGARVEPQVIEAASPEAEIVRVAAEHDADLIVIGTQLRPVRHRAFFGRRVESVIAHATCPVLILTS